ncbi:hypothetical protein O4H61_20775, partial [Roseovarius aestuarii]|nr:hypothetical protein [Roseovarius aestuarii]
MHPLLESLDQLVTDLDRVLSSGGLAGQTDAGRMEVLRTAGEALRRVEAVIVEAVASTDQRFSDDFGCRSLNELLQ